MGVLKNPRLSEQEIESIANMRSVTEDVLRVLGSHRDWVKNYGVVKALATHSVGAVVQPGSVLVTLVPKDDTLSAEVWIANDDPTAAEPCLPCAGDWTRAVQVAASPPDMIARAGAPATRRKPLAAPKAAKAKTAAAKTAARPAAPAPRKAPAGRKTS